MSSLLEKLAEELARDAVEQAKLANDLGVIDAVAKSLADTSTTFKDTFLTCVRYYQADERARLTMPNLKPKPEGLHLPPPETGTGTASASEPASAPEPARTPEPEARDEDDGYAEVEYLDDAPAPRQTPSHRYAGKPAAAAAGAETPAAEPEITGPRKRGH